MIIWSGLGFFIAVIGMGSFMLAEYTSELITKNDEFYQQNPWVALLGSILAACLAFGLHKLLSLQKGRRVIDADTGEEIVLGKNHSFFFVPVKWWPIAFILIGAIFTISDYAQDSEVNTVEQVGVKN